MLLYREETRKGLGGKNMRISLLITILLTTPNCILAGDNGAGQRPVDFFAEEVTLAVDDSFATVTGIYYFRNNTARDWKFPIVFPFHVDSVSLFPEFIGGRLISPDTGMLKVRIQRDQDVAVIEIPLTSKGVSAWSLTFCQRILSPCARYILKSTQSWGRPLDEAGYKFIAPIWFENVQAWPEPDSVVTRGNKKEFFAHRINFMPEHDMEISWGP
jgi:hypothetical protein